MAPALAPVLTRIGDALLALLASITEGATYYNTVETVSDFAKFDANLAALPGISMITHDDSESDEVTVNYITGSLRVVLGLHLIVIDDVRAEVESLVSDVKRAIRSDFSLGGVSLDTHVVATRRWLVPTQTGRAGATVEVVIEYRYRTSDPSQVQ